MEQLSDKIHKAEVVQGKYEVLSREYQNQNKVLKERHEEIIAAENKKRGEIIQNFENHIASVREKMIEDSKIAEEGTSEVAKENQKLSEQFESLKKEIVEKEELMANELIKKKETSSTLEDKMKDQINTQHEEIKKQIELYKQ